MNTKVCPDCGAILTQEMIDVNMCWECGKILDESLIDDEKIEEIERQTKENITYDYISCPVCGKKHKPNTKECNLCGCNLVYNPQFDYREVAQLYNKRLEQCKKNALYEYDVVVISNKATGEVNSEEISAVIRDHAMNGWKLHTMYSNEIGKNAVAVVGVGINVTASEDVLIFERCIKKEQE
ncbi:MAG: hypothetical protein IJ282_09045 [Lachnospiraceae bacterium]|nr:hypothetical protein [Lachnospiraceae bacterium]